MAEEVNGGAQQAPQNGSQNDDARREMARIIAELKQKMAEIDRITQELEQKRKEMEKGSPRKTEKILEEIRVPSLELLK
jgi:hypothetical protein